MRLVLILFNLSTLQFIMSYPMVSKALRDSQRPKDHKVEHHCCGMMNQGCGYQDLDKLMERPEDLEFTFGTNL